jgi:hypothetical protein
LRGTRYDDDTAPHVSAAEAIDAVAAAPSSADSMPVRNAKSKQGTKTARQTVTRFLGVAFLVPVPATTAGADQFVLS